MYRCLPHKPLAPPQTITTTHHHNPYPVFPARYHHSPPNSPSSPFPSALSLILPIPRLPILDIPPPLPPHLALPPPRPRPRPRRRPRRRPLSLLPYSPR